MDKKEQTKSLLSSAVPFCSWKSVRAVLLWNLAGASGRSDSLGKGSQQPKKLEEVGNLAWEDNAAAPTSTHGSAIFWSALLVHPDTGMQYPGYCLETLGLPNIFLWGLIYGFAEGRGQS